MSLQRCMKTLLVATLVCSLVGGCSSIIRAIRGSNRGDGYSYEFNIDGSRYNGSQVDLSRVVAAVPLLRAGGYNDISERPFSNRFYL